MSWSELFPTGGSLTIFIAYISLFIGQGVLVTASQTAAGSYAYNTSMVVLMTEVLKLLMSIALYLRTNTWRSLATSMLQSTGLLKFYMIPSFLYCVYNNLAFVNLQQFDPTTYYLLLQFRVVITGLIFQVIFRKILSSLQWLSLILLTFGCIINRLNFGALFGTDPESVDDGAAIQLHPYMVLILLQAVCSCLAGVYNEYILKNQGADVNIYVQNAFMYIDSIAANLVFIYHSLITQSQPPLTEAVTEEGSIWTPVIMLVMLNNACIGIVTSFFLKYLNSILKTFASALELLFTAVLCYLLFGIPITLNTVLSIAVVSLSIYLYTCAPVKEAATKPRRDSELEETLLGKPTGIEKQREKRRTAEEV